ncbi:DUF1643 domain-containing protein [Trichormus variabilis]|uniref:DUF1643 domain-containing protein n=1 Tax=Trichormus variabilis SAG 1403-4b TaxID=447716 RepID=A0A433UNI1_ANAVA|nr:DUF1643 domain-containing protein [Trichormus variabilis]MBD2626879.1 DUF1643 domain-containing protein [Trichormus variabilis FACHB-164]RUS95381.1 hypothetical protein DSM107003_30840 [Trichormus variabilis SAG 1403-4b]
MEKYANIDGNYRYLLGRKWDENFPQVTFVMLNPSTADHEKDDPTLRKCIKFAAYWGYGSLEVVNLFAYRATKRPDLILSDDPIGIRNNTYIQLATNRAKEIIVAWGGSKYPRIMNRNQEVINLISCKNIYCLGSLTKDGHPRHPLYLPLITERMPFLNALP